jgi:ABC-type multidrug transport system fused ATPase/permease subunit
MGIIKRIILAVFPYRHQIVFRAFTGGVQFLIGLMMALLGWAFGNYLFRIVVFSLFDGWEKFLPEYVAPITSGVLLSWFAWGGLDAAAKFLGMWFSFNHGNFHMYNYLYLVKLKGMHTRKFLPFLRDNPEFIEWAYTLTDAVYVVAYLVLDFLLPFIVMLITIYLFSWIGSGVAVAAWVEWGGALVLPIVALSMYGFTQSIVRGAFHYSRLEQEVGENFDPSSW